MNILLILINEFLLAHCILNICRNDVCDMNFKCADDNEWNTILMENSNSACYYNYSIVKGLSFEHEDFSNLQTNLRFLNKSFQFSVDFTIKMSKINTFFLNKGIEPLLLLNNDTFNQINFSIKLSKLIFLNENNSEIDNSACTFQEHTKFKIFKSIQSLEIESNVQFVRKICQFILINSDLKSLKFERLSNSFLVRNKFQFIDLKYKNFTINSSFGISTLHLNLFGYNLNQQLLDGMVFFHLEYLKIKGTIKCIEKELFSPFSIRKMLFFLSNLREFFHSGTEWFNSLNNDFNGTNFDQENLNLYESKTAHVYFLWDTVTSLDLYDYPNEDFCLFYKFPIEKLIVPFIKPVRLYESLKNCSCTIIWLLRYSKKFENFTDKYFIYENFYDYTISTNFDTEYIRDVDTMLLLSRFNLYNNLNLCNMNDTFIDFLNCNFTKRIQDCQNFDKHSISDTSNFNMIEINEFLMSLKYYFSIILFPLFSFLSLITNALGVLVMSKLKSTDSMYKYIRLNFLFNATYCFIMIFRLIAECLDINSIYCSNIFNTKIVQYFKIYFILYLGTVFKLLSNITFLSSTITRYIKITNKKNKFDFLNKISTRKYLIFIVCFSFMFNLNILFQYKLNIDDTKKLYPIYDIKPNLHHGLIAYDLIVFNIYNFLENCTVYIVFLFPNFIIDIYLYHFLRKSSDSMRKWDHLENNENISKKCDIISLMIKFLREFKFKKEEENKKQKFNAPEKKITYMILLNGLDFLVLRLPEICVFIYTYYYSHIKQNTVQSIFILNTNSVLCNYSPIFLCDTLINIVEIFFVISLFSQCLIYYFLNKNIKEAFYKYFNINDKSSIKPKS